MTKTEFKRLIAQSSSPDWFKTKKVTLTRSNTSIFKEFKDIISLYDFLYSEVKKWDECTLPLPPEFNDSKAYSKKIKRNIESFVETNYNKNADQFDYFWNNHEIRSLLTSNNHIFTFDQPETNFLIDLYNKDRSYFQGAYYFLTNQMRTIFEKKDSFIGASLANEFFGKNTVHKYSRKDAEQKSFDKLRQEFEETIHEASATVVDHLKNTNDKYEEHVNSIEKQKEERDLLFQEWFKSSKKTFEDFSKASNNKVDELKKLYEEEIALKAPVKYWEERSKEMKVQGQWWLFGLCILTLVGVLFLYNLLDSIGTGEFEKMFSNTGSSIKWSIVFITFISFLAFLIRTFTKLTFSSFHLSRDAQERMQLTYVYLALKENNAVSENDRNIVLQSIFSRADTGLLKEDSSPTMPTAIIEKVVKPS